MVSTSTSPMRLDSALVAAAKREGSLKKRSAPKQIEFWAKIGKIVEENPDLPYEFIKDILISKEEVAAGEVTPYEFGNQ